MRTDIYVHYGRDGPPERVYINRRPSATSPEAMARMPKKEPSPERKALEEQYKGLVSRGWGQGEKARGIRKQIQNLILEGK